MAVHVTRRDMLKLGFATFGAAALGACTPKAPTAAPPKAATSAPAAATKPAAKSVTLTASIVDWAPEVQTWLEKDGMAEYQAQFPGRQVQINYTTWSRYNEELTTAFAGGVAPDLFQGGALWVPQMYRRGWSLILDDYVAKAGSDWDWEDFYPVVRNDCAMEGKLSAVAFRMDTRYPYYRDDILKEVGAKPPTTWDELVEAAAKCTKRDGDKIVREGYHFADPVASMWQNDVQSFLPFIHQAGGEFLTADAKQCKLDQKPVVDALQFLKDLVYKHKVMPYPGFEPQGDTSPIMAGTAAMITNGSPPLYVNTKRFAPQVLDSLKTAMPLKGPGGQWTHVWINKYHIAKTSKEAGEAWNLLQFLTSKGPLAVYNNLAGFLTVRKSAASVPNLLPSTKMALDSAGVAKVYPQHHRTLDMLRPFAAALSETLSNKTPPQEALAKATKDIQKIIDEG